MSEKPLTRKQLKSIANRAERPYEEFGGQIVSELVRDLTAARDALQVVAEICEQSLADLESDGWPDTCETGAFWREKLAIFKAQLPEDW